MTLPLCRTGSGAGGAALPGCNAERPCQRPAAAAGAARIVSGTGRSLAVTLTSSDLTGGIADGPVTTEQPMRDAAPSIATRPVPDADDDHACGCGTVRAACAQCAVLSKCRSDPHELANSCRIAAAVEAGNLRAAGGAAGAKRSHSAEWQPHFVEQPLSLPVSGQEPGMGCQKRRLCQQVSCWSARIMARMSTNMCWASAGPGGYGRPSAAATAMTRLQGAVLAREVPHQRALHRCCTWLAHAHGAPAPA